MTSLAHQGLGPLTAFEFAAGGAVVAAAFLPGWLSDRARWSFAGGGVALVAAAALSIEDGTSRSLSVHMVQHLLLVAVAAPLLAVAATELGGRSSFPGTRKLFQSLVRPASAPLAAGIVHVATIVFWHLPGPYDTAVGHGALHAADHVTLLATGIWWWASMAHHVMRRRPLAPILSVFVVATACAAFGIVLMFAPRPWTASGHLADQQIAGAVMAGAGLLYWVAALAGTAAAVAKTGRSRPERIPVRARAAGLASLGPVLVTAAATTVGAVVGFGESPPTTMSPPVGAQDDPDGDGRQLYLRDCAWCHGTSGAGTNRGVAIDTGGTAAVRYVLDTGRMPIGDPLAAVRRGDPAYTPDQIDALVAYAATFVEGPEIRQLATSTGDVAAGGELYRRHCSACHGATGNGGAQAADRSAPSLMHASPVDVASAVVAGPGGMPGFETILVDREIASITAYVELLQDPPAKGVPIPGGRVGEGLVAWVVGMGTVVTFAWWIGRSTR